MTFRTFTVVSEWHDPISPVAIRFVPVRRSRKIQFDAVKAVAVRMNGKEALATPADISVVTGKQFFDSQTTAIGRERLVRWLNGEISDEQAATE